MLVEDVTEGEQEYASGLEGRRRIDAQVCKRGSRAQQTLGGVNSRHCNILCAHAPQDSFIPNHRGSMNDPAKLIDGIWAQQSMTERKSVWSAVLKWTRLGYYT